MVEPVPMLSARQKAALEQELAMCEASIHSNNRLTGLRFRTIRDKRLYKLTHKTFEDYCQKRWGVGRNYVNKLIKGADVAFGEDITQDLKPKPHNESQTRPIAGFHSKEFVKKVWEAAAAKNGGKAPPGRLVKETLYEFEPILKPVMREKTDRELMWGLMKDIYNDGTPENHAEAVRVLSKIHAKIPGLNRKKA